ncbi:hypothetical protein HAX54_022236, partial [Datura stramonium]|nr:hypothetical protein [Datura stramonium]
MVAFATPLEWDLLNNEGEEYGDIPPDEQGGEYDNKDSSASKNETNILDTSPHSC